MLCSDKKNFESCKSHEYYGYLGGPGQKPSNKQPKVLNLLILVHLRNYFIKALNNFLTCFEIMG